MDAQRETVPVKTESIKHAPSTAGKTGEYGASYGRSESPRDGFTPSFLAWLKRPDELDESVPNWCNLGVALRVMIGVNVAIFGVHGALAPTFSQWLEQCLGSASLLEPILIAGLFFGCLLRRVTSTWPSAFQILVALAIPVILTFSFEYLLKTLLDLDFGQILRDCVVAGGICAAILYGARLRDQSYLPALSQARLEALQARIQPHFLFNSLNAVLGLIRTEPRRAESVLEDMADLFRVLLRDSGARVSLSEEVELCRRYLAIEALRLGERLEVVWGLDEDALVAKVPSLLLQPLLENAIHHGIEPRREGGTIEISIRRVGQYAHISIGNLLAEDGSNHVGHRIGLDNVRQRLMLMHDLEARLETSVENGWFVVRMRVPLDEN